MLKAEGREIIKGRNERKNAYDFDLKCYVFHLDFQIATYSFVNV